jgi:hypothetical protein
MTTRTLVRICALAACVTAHSTAPAAPKPPPPAPSAVPPPPAATRFLKLDGTGVEVTAVGFDASHALYVAGTFSSRLVLGGASVRSPSADQRAQIFLARLTPRGDVDWLIRVGSQHPADLHAMSVAPDGSVALAGHYEWTIGADHGPARALQVDAFVIVIGPDGKVRWDRRIDGKQRQIASAVHRAADGTVFVGGYHEDETRFGPRHRATSAPGPYVASLDVFLARFSPTGDVEWVATGGGSDDDRLQSLAVTPSGDIAVIGEIGRSARFGDGAQAVHLPGPPPHAALANPDRTFVASYSAAGALRWAIQTGSKDSSYTPLSRALSDGSVLFHGWDQDLGGARTPYLLHVDARGTVLRRREVAELGGIVADPASLLSARASGNTLVFERHTGAASSPEGPALSVPGAALKVTALARGSDGRIAVAGTTGEPTSTQIAPRTSSITFENVDGYLAIAPSISALRAR